MKTVHVYPEGDADRPMVFEDARRLIIGKTGLTFWYREPQRGWWSQIIFFLTKIRGFSVLDSQAQEPKEAKSAEEIRAAVADAAVVGGV